MTPAVEHDPGSSDPARDSAPDHAQQSAPDPAQDPARSRITDPEGQASFLDAVRTLVHGERVVEPRADSDSWEPPAEPGSARATSDGLQEDVADNSIPVAAASEDLADWLPGRWVAEPAPAWSSPTGRRGGTTGSGKSEKSSRRRRSGRTVDPAARRGAPGAEVLMDSRHRAPELDPSESVDVVPELEPPPEPLLSRRARRRATTRERTAGAALERDVPEPDDSVDRKATKKHVRGERQEAKARTKAERKEAGARLKEERKASREAAAAERAATKARAVRRRQDAKEQAVLDRAAALAAKAQARIDRDSAAAATKIEQRSAAVEASAARETEKTRAAAEREAAEEQVRLDRDAAAAVEAEAKTRREAEEAQARAEREAEQARADAEREAAEEQAKAEREAAEEQARLDREAEAAAEAEARAGREAEKARIESERLVAQEQARAEREAAKEHAQAERAAAAAAKVDAKAEKAAAEAQQAAAKTRAKLDRELAEARSKAERKAASAARARDEAEREAATEQARVDKLAEEALAEVARAKARSEARASGAATKAEARIARVTSKADARVARAKAKAQGKVHREAAKAQAELERAAAKAQTKVDRASGRAASKAEVAAALTHDAAELDARIEAWDFTGEPSRRREGLADYIARVESRRAPSTRRRTPRRTGVKVALVTVVVAACAVVPWAAPSVPKMIADLVPGGDSAPRVIDPPIDPPSASAPPEVVTQQAQGLSGVRLEAAGAPREVAVPRLHVDSEVVPISGQSGSLLPPSDPQQLGWWREGQPAGAEAGSAVVTGHTVHTGGGALDHLDKLVVGDTVRVRTDAGWIRYVVQRTRIYSTEQLARDAKDVFKLDGPGRLVLITCDDWNGVTYESNAVVFAAPVEEQASSGDVG